MNTYRLCVGLLCLFLGCPADAAEKIDKGYKKTPQATKSIYAKNSVKNATVLLAVNWGRRWSCGGYENAQLVGLGFDLVGGDSRSVTTPPDLYIQSPSRIFVNPVFTNYAFVLAPGIYGISYFKIKAAKSRTDIGYLTGDRSKLFNNDLYEGGTFEARAGEVVYIGNFWIDCAFGPMPWRYFSTMDTFADHLKEYSKQYKFIPVDQVQYRLFSSNVFSNPSDNTYGQKIEHEIPNTK